MAEDIIKLVAKVVVRGQICVVTGLHIGGSKSALDIGGLDLDVIKTVAGVPYIPGSSLKGKLRTILARRCGSVNVDKDAPYIKRLFGQAGHKQEVEEPTRLIVRDCFLDASNVPEQTPGADRLNPWTEIKWENTINRKTGTAVHPRQLERVPPGTLFNFEIVYNVFNEAEEEEDLKNLIWAMRVLQDDYLGGQGSRGYGKIEFKDVSFTRREIEDFEKGSGGKTQEQYAI